MKYIYIKNYLKLSPKQKGDFLDFINTKSRYFKVLKQEVIFSEESLLLEFIKESDMKLAYLNLQDFFEKLENIKVYSIKKTFDNEQMILSFNNSNKKIRV